MIGPEYVRMMADYNAEMNRRVYAAAARLGEAGRREDGGAFWKSVHGTLSHVYWGDRIWLARFGLGRPPEVGIDRSGEYVAEFDDLAARRALFDAEIIDWAAGLAQSEIDGDLTWFSGASGREMTRPRAMCLTQIFNHQTHHRGQVHALLTRAGETTGATDLPFVL